MIKKKLLSFIVAGAMTVSMLSSLATPSNYVQAATLGIPYEDGLVAYWNFDNNYEETKSGLTTNLGAKQLKYTEGIYGEAAVFNGKDNYLVVNADPVLNFGNDRENNNDKFTISAWINLGDASYSTKYLLDKGTDIGWDKDDGCYWTNPYRVKIDVCEPIVDLSNYFEDISNDDNRVTQEGDSTTRGKHVEGQDWFLLTVTYDGSRVKIYQDNVLLTQSNYTGGIAFNEDDLYIGVDGKLKDFFKGTIDDLRLYSTALSYDDIDGLYQKGLSTNPKLVDPKKQLVAYYPFDDNLNDESTFKNNAEKVAVGGTTKYIVGKNGKAITMSKGNYINVPAGDQLNFDTEYTVSFWLKLDKKTDDVTYPVLYQQNPSNTDDNDNDWTYKCYVESWGSMDYNDISFSATVLNPDEWVPEYAVEVRTLTDYETNKYRGYDWVHYSATYKDGQLKTYINGVLKNKNETSDLVNIYNASGDLLIGYDGSSFIEGAIDELKLYNKCLTATEVDKEYKRVDSIKITKAIADKLSALGKGKSVTINSILLYDVDKGKTSTIKLAKKNFTFKTSNKKIFTVSDNGKITGVAAGSANLTITYGGNSVTYKVTVVK